MPTRSLARGLCAVPGSSSSPACCAWFAPSTRARGDGFGFVKARGIAMATTAADVDPRHQAGRWRWPRSWGWPAARTGAGTMASRASCRCHKHRDPPSAGRLARELVDREHALAALFGCLGDPHHLGVVGVPRLFRCCWSGRWRRWCRRGRRPHAVLGRRARRAGLVGQAARAAGGVRPRAGGDDRTARGGALAAPLQARGGCRPGRVRGGAPAARSSGTRPSVRR